MQKIFITRLIPEKAISMLREHFSVRINKKKGQLTKEELVSRIKDTFGLLPLLTDR
ncbi:MAG: D-glycerate dehydrogenase, partial [Candidatus Cloacimonadota bacterium]